MKFFTLAAALASVAAAAPSAAPSPLDVKIESAGSSGEVKATITNTGKDNLKIFKHGTIFDNAHTEKATIEANGSNVEFQGLRLRLSTEKLTDEDFQKIDAGQSIEVTFHLAETHDLSAGGKYSVSSTGVLSYATEADNKLIGSVSYTSNAIEAEIDGAIAAAVHGAIQARYEKRTHVQSDCTGSRRTGTINALKNCVALSTRAADAARSGPAAKVEEYFKSSSSSTRSTIVNVLNNVAQECGSTDGGASRYYCTDQFGGCGDRVLAYTQPSRSLQVYCDLYWDDLPALTSACHRQDQATTTLHEMTHLREVAGTADNGYGYDNIRKLTTAQSLNNADSYAMFANAIYSGC
ncbi:Peptidase M35, deuterolysin [Cordyceps fumosorosea ARSEF 2679]|uniref:Neutral protease 2 n=1 Tax=Cordyceps fumosorosea (strain ARSEF 2679) TaxID=1081104 RepID=A0A168B707_CORFA|nr:Peptidase M35, deuterolysin [Cordyceps fumosorosea ARSEF 2679]OAA69710.1 Peptidase M35, deuterolysin [Cordyceps fumosorosea ARSEF 2679]